MKQLRLDDESTRPAFAKALRRDIKTCETLLVGYSLVEPPPAFRTTHRLLLRRTRTSRDAELYFEEKISGGFDPIDWGPEWGKIRAKVVRAHSDSRVALRVASRKCGVKPPAKMLETRGNY